MRGKEEIINESLINVCRVDCGFRIKSKIVRGQRERDGEKALVDHFNEECLRMTFLEGAMGNKSSVHKPTPQRK